MRNLLRFLFTYRIFLLFLFLETFALSLLYRGESYQRSAMREKALQVAGSFHQWRSGWTYYFHLKDENEILKSENAQLRNQIQSMNLRRDLFMLPDSAEQLRFSFIPANVVYNTTSSKVNRILLDKGRKDGFTKYMGVLNQNGVVGVVRDVSDHHAIGLSLLNVKLKLNAKLKSSGYAGIVNWEGVSTEDIHLLDIPYHVNVEVGDTVVTNSFSQLFPADIPIGYVRRADRIPGSNYWKIELATAVDFRKIGPVYGVVNSYRDEVDSLLNASE